MYYTYEMVKEMCAERGFILDEVEYINSTTKMTCHDNEEFYYNLSMSNFAKGKTPYRFSRFNSYTIQNIQRLLDTETDGVKILSTEYMNNKTKLAFQCSCGECFEMTINDLTNGKRYCNYCARVKRYDANDYTSNVQEKCKEINCTLITKPPITRQTQKIEYQCNIHPDQGVMSCDYYSFMKRKTGCILCGIKQRGEKHRIPVEDLKSLCEEKGFIFNDCDYVRWTNGAHKVRIHATCKQHIDKGIQFFDYGNLKINKCGCKYCIGQGRTQESYQKELNDNHRNITILEFNGYMDILAKCDKCEYVWKAKGVNLTQGHGCPRCNHSRYEKMVERVLLDQNITHIPQHWFPDCRDAAPLPFDFYLPDKNVLIEVDGQGHYRPINFGGISDEKATKAFELTKKHDAMKTAYCKEHNIPLFRIPYYDLDNKQINLAQYILNGIEHI